MNVEENDGVGKCCSFKNVTYRTINDQENEQPSDANEIVLTEIFFGDTTDNSLYDSAKLEEIQKWKDFKTFKEVPNQGQQLVSTRWVCTRKIKGGEVCHKARLVARGFEEHNKDIQKDSPTCAKESLRLTLAIISSFRWKLQSLDVKSAFLQGNQMDRDVYIKPPKEANTRSIWKMLKCPYGLVDAGRLWYLRLKSVLIQLGLTICKYDHALFMWFDQKQLSGILVCHVDDIVFGGNRVFHLKVMEKIRSIFVIGLEENTNLKYLGLALSQNKSGIQLSTKDYGSSINEIKRVSRGNDDKTFSPEQVKILKQFCGQLNWLSSQGRPDISFDSCYISNGLKSGNDELFTAANKVVRKIKNQSMTLNFYSDFDICSCSVITFSDASFANLPNAGSQGGYLSLLVDNQGIYVPIAWQSRKIRRVVKSTIGAECLAAVEAAEMTLYIATLIKDVSKTTRNIKTYVYCDNKNLVNAVHASTNLEDKRLVIDISVLRDLLNQQELTDFVWVDTKSQLADALTKRGASDKLLVNVINNKLRFHFQSVSFD